MNILITSDFEDYVSGAREDKLYWILASVEGSYSDVSGTTGRSMRQYTGRSCSVFDVKVQDFSRKEVDKSEMIIRHAFTLQ